MDKINPLNHIMIRGARQHNLKNIDINIPKNQLVVLTGVSGSGKSTLAFDTIYAEGQRKYVESLSSYARQFLGLMHKPDVDQIDGLSPAISIDQKTTSHNPRSTVGTITEIYDYLRLLFARIGHPHCPECGIDIAPQSIDQIRQQMLDQFKYSINNQVSRWLVLAPLVKDKRGEYSGLLKNLKVKGFKTVRIDNRLIDLSEEIILIKTNKHTIDVVVDRLSWSKKELFKSKDLEQRLNTAIEVGLELADGSIILSKVDDASFEFPANPTSMHDYLYSQSLACPKCNVSLPDIEPRLFSFNTPHGACSKCSGLGNLLKFDIDKIIAPDISISEGAFIPLANAFTNETFVAKIITNIISNAGSSIRIPYKKLPEQLKNVLIYGTGNNLDDSSNGIGKELSMNTKFRGVLALLRERYERTESDFIRYQLESFMTKEICPECVGSRLKKEALSVTVDGVNINKLTSMSIKHLGKWIIRMDAVSHSGSDEILTPAEKTISKLIFREIHNRLNFLISVGLDYLTLDREAGSLAGGESQRIRLASQIGTGLTGVLYVLDEPSIGLHPRDNDRLINTLKKLKELGNSVLVVEHDQTIMKEADYLVDIGPKAGEHGGEIVFAGTPKQIITSAKSLTGKYLSGKKQVLLSRLNKLNKINRFISLKGCRQHNLKNMDVSFPLNRLTVVTGVSGSGKSTLIHDTLFPALKLKLNQRVDYVGDFDNLSGAEDIKRVSLIDQSPIGRTPRSNPVTYTKTFDLVRDLFSKTRDAKEQGYKAGRFSFNVKGGRCEACRGDGQVKISMQFLPDVYVNCDICKGKRYNQGTLNIEYRNKHIAQVLDMTVSEALIYFKNQSKIVEKLKLLEQVGLGYIRLGQPAPTLSGGEAQRVKLARELSTSNAHHTVYLLDEPTTGLHFEDVKHLLLVLSKLVSRNNTVIVIEHNLDVIRNADYIIDLGPEGGDGGGQLIAEGTPEEIIAINKGYTAGYINLI